MKILLVHPGPHFSVSDIHDGLLKALRTTGCHVETLNLHERLAFYSAAGRLDDTDQFQPMLTAEGAFRLAAKGLEAVCFEWWPDAVVIVSCFFIPDDTLDIIRARGIAVVIIHTESPYEDDRQIGRAVHADLNLLNDPVNIDRFQQVAPSLYLPHCYDPAVHHPGPSTRPSDFAFVGTAYPSRVAFFEAVDWSGIDVALGGNWGHIPPASPLLAHLAHDSAECMDNADAADLYRGAKVSANLYRQEGETGAVAGWAMGPREVELAATGCFFLREPRGEGDAVLSMLPTFDGPGDFGDKLRWWLAHPRQRAEVVEQARSAISDRTFTRNARALIGVLAQPKGKHNGKKSWAGITAFRGLARRRQRNAGRLSDEMVG